MSDNVFHLPDLGEGLTEAEIVTWHVRAGDRVKAGDPLVTVETDKAVVDIPAPRSAQIVECHGAEGDVVTVGAPLVTFQGGAADTGGVVGRLPEAAAVSAPAVEPPAPSAGQRQRVRASPKARQRARELGVDLATVQPQGAIIQAEDVERVAAASTTPGTATVVDAGKSSRDLADTSGATALRGVRRAMARRMADAHRRVVPALVTDEADISTWTDAQRPLPRLVRAIVAASAAEPLLNAWFDDAALTLNPQTGVQLGIAMETDDGLFVPVLRDAETRTLTEIGTAVTELEAAVRSRSIAPEALRGQTISLSNFGAVAGQHAQMVVVPPQVAIVGAGRAFERAAWVDGAARGQRVLPISLTFDHRAVTGVEACRFLLALLDDLHRSD
ncbi:MAG: dihydrolipoamide acetyltransferase family protein [Pseudomonadales bacterium]